MDKTRAAAIIILGLGDKFAEEILRNMPPENVEEIINTIDTLNEVSEEDVIRALNEFFKDVSGGSGVDYVTKENLKMSLSSIVESRRIESENDAGSGERMKWIDVFKMQASDRIYNIIESEHPQVIAAVIAIILPSQKGSEIFKALNEDLKKEVLNRMTTLQPVSTAGMDYFAQMIESELQVKEKHAEITVDGLDAVANIISHLDSETERSILNQINEKNEDIADKLEAKILPFENLITLDKKSIQTLLTEVENDDLVLALKGADGHVKNAFLNNMSSKAADILVDELDSKGPVKLSNVIAAQKKIVALAKKMAAEEKIVLTLKADSDIVY